MEISTDNICRICLKESLFHFNICTYQVVNGKQLLEVINDLLHLDVEYDDGFPQFVCPECYKNISYFELFKRTAHEGKYALHSLRGSYGNADVKSEFSNGNASYCGRSNLMQPNEESVADPDDDHLSYPVKVEPEDYEEYEEYIGIEPDDDVEVKKEIEEPLFSSSEDCQGHVNSADLTNDEQDLDFYWQVNVKIEEGTEPIKFQEEENEEEQTAHSSLYNTTQVNRSSTNNTLEEEGEEDGGANKEVRRQKVEMVTSTVKEIEGNGKQIDKSEEANSPDASGRCRKITANNQLEGKRSRKRKVCNVTHDVLIQNANLEKTEMKNNSIGVFSQESSRYDTQLRLENLTGDEQVEHLSRTHSFLEKINVEPSPRDIGWYFCYLCQKGFFDQCSLGNHLRGHMGLDPIRCVNGRRSTSKGVHRLRAEAMDGGNVCSVCGKAFKEEYCLEAHMRRYHLDQGKRSKSLCKQNRFFCDACGKGCYRKRDLMSHIRVHTGERSFRCDICSKAFSYKNNLKEHVLSHGSERPNQCRLCGKRFTYRSGLADHIETHLEKRYGCTFCEKKFFWKSALKRHLTTHSDEKPFVCDVCGKTFKVASGLSRHLGAVHGGVKRFRCDICGQEFFWKSVLDNHIKLHGDERPYACKVCDKTFKTRNCARTHQRTHSVLKPHSCTFCTKRFLTTGQLKKHLRTHTLEKPFECANCGTRFSQSSSLGRHKKSCSKKEMAT